MSHPRQAGAPQLRRAAGALIFSEVARSRIPSLTGHEEGGARNVTAALVDRGMLTAASHRAPLRLAFPAEVAERWFPGLYPAGAGSHGS